MAAATPVPRKVRQHNQPRKVRRHTVTFEACKRCGSVEAFAAAHALDREDAVARILALYNKTWTQRTVRTPLQLSAAELRRFHVPADALLTEVVLTRLFDILRLALEAQRRSLTASRRRIAPAELAAPRSS